MNIESLWNRVPQPPKVGPFRPGAFSSRLHDERTAAVLGIALGASFLTCFATGLYSHELQHPASWFSAFPRPVGLFRLTQGIHIATGLASIPLLFAKLWTVFPKLFTWPPFKSVAQAAERVFLLPLIGGALFLLFSGLNNINGRYPYGQFNFVDGHYWAAWITIGSLVVHIGAKISTTRTALRRDHTPHLATETTNAFDPTVPTNVNPLRPSPLTRRTFFGVAFGTSGLVTIFTVGQTFAPLRKLALLAPRRTDIGPQGFPINGKAEEVGLQTVDLATYRLKVHGRGIAPIEFTYQDLLAMTPHTAELPIACVEGWSSSQVWTGVSLRTVLQHAAARPNAAVGVAAMVAAPTSQHPHPGRGSYGRSEISAAVASDADCLLAMKVNGEALHPDHGFPLRLIAPNRPGVLQTKWINEIVVR